ncbi:MAG TPA: SRPBCC family protein [Burkholderiaceae bacterium]|jgi:uncharacterized protein YndB with AHSA1/START domain
MSDANPTPTPATQDASFVYVTYIRTTPEKLWAALTTPEFIHQYWFGMAVTCDWTAGSPWRLNFEDGRLADSGEILEADPPKRLVIRWRNEFRPELTAEGHSRCTMALERMDGGAVKLTLTHALENTRPASKFVQAVSGGWPMILSNLKSLLETGEVAMPSR